MSNDPVLEIVDAQAGGDITRVIVDGAPVLRGATVKEQCADFARRFDHLRLKLIRPPFGELHMCPVVLLPPGTDDVDIGVIIMESMGYPPISGSNLFCAAAVALERRFVPAPTAHAGLRVATPAGTIAVSVARLGDRHYRTAFENVPARITREDTADVDGAAIPVTVVSAGVDYAITAADILGIGVTRASTETLVRVGRQLASAAGTDFALLHDPIQIVGDDAHCTVAVFQKPSVICRSPTGTGTSALLTLAYHRGLTHLETSFTASSSGGGAFIGRALGVVHESRGPGLRTTIAGEVTIGRSHRIA